MNLKIAPLTQKKKKIDRRLYSDQILHTKTVDRKLQFDSEQNLGVY